MAANMRNATLKQQTKEQMNTSNILLLKRYIKRAL